MFGRSVCFEGFFNVEEARLDIVSLSHQAGFEEADEEDVINLLESKREPLTIEEFMELDQEKALSSDDEEEESELRMLEAKVLHSS